MSCGTCLFAVVALGAAVATFAVFGEAAGGMVLLVAVLFGLAMRFRDEY